MRRSRLSLCLAAAAATVATSGGVALAEPLPTETKYIYVDIDYTAVLIGPNAVRLTYRCKTSATVLAASAGVTCGSAASSETLFLPGPHVEVVRTEVVPANAVWVSVTGTGVFTDGTILSVSCSSDNVPEPTKHVACDRFA